MDTNELGGEKQSTELRDLFLFEIDGDLYAVPVELVDRVMKIPPVTPIPNAPSAILGIFHARGKVILVIDIASRMNIPKVKPLSPNFLFVAKMNKEYYAILIDKPKNIVHIPIHEILPAGALVAAHMPPQYVDGVFMHVEVPAHKPLKHSFLIVAATNIPKNDEAIKSIKRPVVLLNLTRLLDQEDLKQIFASQES